MQKRAIALNIFYVAWQLDVKKGKLIYVIGVNSDYFVFQSRFSSARFHHHLPHNYLKYS